METIQIKQKDIRHQFLSSERTHKFETLLKDIRQGKVKVKSITPDVLVQLEASLEDIKAGRVREVFPKKHK